MFFLAVVIRYFPMELVELVILESLIDQALDDCDLTHGLCVSVHKSKVVFEEGNNWASYIEPKEGCRDSYQPSPEAKKMILKLLGDMRLKYNLK